MKKHTVFFFALIVANITLPTNLNFARRFGSNSPIYNTPLYFGYGRYQDKNTTNKTCNYRKKIQKQIESNKKRNHTV